MTTIFVFLGEFGFELFNWQGVVRKFSQSLEDGDKIVCCSRANLYPLYESADAFVDISQVEIFQRSRAFVYWGTPTREGVVDSLQALRFDRQLKRDISAYVLERLRADGVLADGAPHRFIFSSDHTVLNDCEFGRSRGSLPRILAANTYRGLKTALPFLQPSIEAIKRLLFKTTFSPDFDGAGNIYDKLDYSNNVFQKIEPDFSIRDEVEAKLGWSLDEPFVLCQTRIRETNEISKDSLPADHMETLFNALAAKVRVVALTFRTGRMFDSFSVFENSDSCSTYSCGSFPEQALLIHFASQLLFFSEGDFGSHIYIPPLLGKDVTVIAPRSVYAILTTSPIEGEAADPLRSWNENVYRFGGQIVPKVAEDVFASPAKLQQTVDDIVQRVPSTSGN